MELFGRSGTKILRGNYFEFVIVHDYSLFISTLFLFILVVRLYFYLCELGIFYEQL